MKTTIVIPCYNEEKRLDVTRLEEFARGGQASLLFVNDGSTDGTLKLLQELAAKTAAISVIDLAANSGKAEAVRQGINHAAGEEEAVFVGFWDADLATPLAELPRFIRRMTDDPALELVTGARVKLLGRNIRRRVGRHYIGRLAATAISGVLQLPVYDTQCGAKLFRVDERLREVFAEPFLSRWIFDVEIIARYQQRYAAEGKSFAGAMYELPLDSWEDVDGSKVRGKDFIRAGSDLWKIYRRYRRR
jgi:glycosyltransferase involved in cell wall biosynthesis